jgi:oxygen-independent coproporphyrinogen-3 oxidase
VKKGIYVHVPFCLSKCPYCSFNSYPSREGVPASYVDAVLWDIERESQRWAGTRFATVYFGGGTPSLLSPGQASAVMSALRASFLLEAGAEVTLECNPATVDPESLSAFAQAGVNRLSIGVQSLDARELVALGRIHNPREAIEAVRAASVAGLGSVSADVMLGIPGQTRRSLACTVEWLAGKVAHISVYMFSMERGTPFHAMASRGLAAGPDDLLLADLYEYGAGLLERAGFGRYEISNWALPGRRCEHNLIYWRRGDYLGIGAGSHSHRAGHRCSKIRSPLDYTRALAGGGEALEFEERLSEDQVMLEEVLLGLRTSQGLDLAAVRDRRPSCGERMDGMVAGLLREGYASNDGKYLTLSTKGFLLHEEISAEIASVLSASAA